MNNTHTNGRRNRRRSLMAKSVAILGATAGLVALGATTATAAAAATSENTQETFTYTMKPWESIHLPYMMCYSGYLEDVDYSPGRIVPRGVEVIEPGGIGVFVYKAKTGISQDGGKTWPLIGIDSVNGLASATNWDPFTSRTLTVKLHCTGDIDKAAKKTIVPGFPEA